MDNRIEYMLSLPEFVVTKSSKFFSVRERLYPLNLSTPPFTKVNPHET